MPRSGFDSSWFRFFPDKYLGGTIGFTKEMHGAYLMVLLHQWKSGPFSSEDGEKIAGKTWDKIKHKFEKTYKGLVNKTMEEEAWHKRKVSEGRSKAVQMRYNCTSNEVSIVPACIISHSSLNSSDLKEGENEGKKNDDHSWRTSFETYRSDAEKEFDRLHDDVKWVSMMRIYHPGVQVRLTVQKMWEMFWSKTDAWEWCKVHRKGKTLNWQRCIEINFKKDRVYPQRGEIDREKEWVEMELKNAESKN